MGVTPSFKQTEIGTIPEDWFCSSIKEIASSRPNAIVGGPFGSDLVSKDYVVVGIPVIRGQNMAKRYVSGDFAFVSKQKAKQLQANTARAGDVIFTQRGTLGQVSLVPSGPFPEYIVSQSQMKLTLNTSYADARFIYQYFISGNGQRRVLDSAIQTGVPHTNLGILKTYKIPLPPNRAEQEAIAEALSDADALVESLEQLLAKKRQIKQGAMQELLTGKKRLPGFSGEWETTRLGQIGFTYGGLTGKSKQDFGHGPARFITFMNIMSNVVIDSDAFDAVNVRPSESQNRAIKGDLFFNGSSETPEEVGMCAYLDTEVRDVYLNSFCFGFRARVDAPVDRLYLAYYFRSNQGRELLKSLAQGATRYNLSKTALLRVEFPLPQRDEQAAITRILSDMDAEMAVLETKLTKARQLKQGMMQVLLTGQIRLPLDTAA